MPMQENEERLSLRMKAKEVILAAGSPILPSQLAQELNTNNHMVDRILNEFESNRLIETFKIGINTSNPVTTWKATPILKKVNEKKMAEIIEIKKPRDKK